MQPEHRSGPGPQGQPSGLGTRRGGGCAAGIRRFSRTPCAGSNQRKPQMEKWSWKLPSSQYFKHMSGKDVVVEALLHSQLLSKGRLIRRTGLRIEPANQGLGNLCWVIQWWAAEVHAHRARDPINLADHSCLSRVLKVFQSYIATPSFTPKSKFSIECRMIRPE